MVARPGRMQSATTAGEIDPSLHDRWELKYFSTGLRRAENVQIIPQGGFTLRDGLRDIGQVDGSAERICQFEASDGSSYDLVFSHQSCAVWGLMSQLDTFATGISAEMMREFTTAQQLDTMLLFHNNLKTQRIRIRAADDWQVDDLAYEGLPNYDYGAIYTNGVPAKWSIEFIGLSPAAVAGPDQFRIYVSRDGGNPLATSWINFTADMTVLATRIQNALLNNFYVNAGLVVASVSGSPSGNRVRVTFSGAGNVTHDWNLVGSTNQGQVIPVKVDEGDGSTLPEVWEIEFNDLSESGTTTGGSVFILTVSNQDTQSIAYRDDMASLANAINEAISDLPNVNPGITVNSPSAARIDITFTGTGNEGDGWAISSRVVNKADAAVLAFKETPGVPPGEPLISEERGFPHCGAFYGQRLLVGGFKSLPNAWMMSKVGDYYNFDQRLTEANGPALIPMDVPGGERIERIVPNRNLLIFTTKAEYWLAERSLSKTSAPNHVQSSRNGTRRGVPIVENEGTAVYVHANGDVLGEFRYTDVEGNFVSTDISLLAPHLVNNVKDQALRRSAGATSGNLNALIQDDGQARLITVLREQEVTAFTRMVTAGTPIAVSVNGRNEMSWIMQRPDGRRLERFEYGLLLDGALSFAFGVATSTITGLERFNGQVVWAVAHDDVFGPFAVAGGKIDLPVAVTAVTVGSWSPPVVDTLPLPRTVGPNIVLRRRARIHSVVLSLIDTTSIALGVNGKPPRDLDLLRYGAPADVPELQAAFTGEIKIRGLTGYQDDPFVRITQLRPGRMTVRSVTIEAAL